MTTLEEYDLARQLWRYAGKKLEYIDLTGKRGSGILEGMEVHQETKELIALFRNLKYTNILPCLFPPTKVPLRQVILPTTRQTSTRMQNSTGASGKNASSAAGQRFKNFQYYNNLYVITYMRNFKTGDEVVWTRYSSGDVAYMGFIVVTAERQDAGDQVTRCVSSEYQEVAIIKFDITPYTYTGEKAPGYFAYMPGIENTFLIPMNELLKLSEWIAVTAKVEDNSHRDLWQRSDFVHDTMSENERLNINNDIWSPSVICDANQQTFTPVMGPQRLNFKREIKLQRPLENVQIERTLSSLDTEPSASVPWDLDVINSLPEKVSHEQLESPQDKVQSDNDALKFSPIWENEWLLPINHAQFFSKIEKGGGFGIGVQGKNNSSYMDSSLWALFSFNKTFDSCLHHSENEKNDKLISRVKKVMRNDIILSIRQEFHVQHEKVLELCELLGQEINSDCADVEEFLTGLFIKMGTPPLLNYDDGDGDYFHRIALPTNWQGNRFVPYLTVQSLLESSFETYNVKLTTLPHGGLIIKLPVSDGSLIPCAGVIPNLTLNMCSVVSSKSSSAVDNNIMNLRSVICQRDGHFVAFVRTGLEKNSPWIFMDSNPTMCAFAMVLPDVDTRIEKALGVIEGGKLGAKVDMHFDPHYQQIYQPVCHNFSLFQNAYICLYV